MKPTAVPTTFATLRDVVSFYVNSGNGQQQTAFLCSYHCFCSSDDLFGELSALFAGKAVPEERVVGFLERWVRLGRADFKQDAGLAERLVVWMSNNLESHGSDAVKLMFVARDDVAPLPDDMKTMLPVPSSQSTVNHKFLDWTNTRIAEHLTIIEADIYNRMLPQEFVDLAWQRDNREELAPNLVRLAERFNSVAFWVAATIVFAPEAPRTTQHAVNKWISVAWTLWKMGNYQTALAVVSGLTHGAVQRLKLVWASLAAKYQERFAQLDQLFSPLHGYRAYRDAIAKSAAAGGPHVPYMPAVLGDLAMQSVGNPTRIDGNINNEKITMVGARIHDALRFQPARFNVATPDPSLIMYFMSINLSGTTEDDLYAESKRREPVRQQDGSPARLAVAEAAPKSAQRRTSAVALPGQSPQASASGSISRIFSKVRPRRGSVFMAHPSAPAPALPSHISSGSGLVASSSSPNLKSMFPPSPSSAPHSGAAHGVVAPIPVSGGGRHISRAAQGSKSAPVSTASPTMKQPQPSLEIAKASLLSLSRELQAEMELRKTEKELTKESLAPAAATTRLHRSGSWPVENPRMKLPKDSHVEGGVVLPLIVAPIVAKKRPMSPPPPLPLSAKDLAAMSPKDRAALSPKDRSAVSPKASSPKDKPAVSPKKVVVAVPKAAPVTIAAAAVVAVAKGKEEEEGESGTEDETSSIATDDAQSSAKSSPKLKIATLQQPPVARILFPLPTAAALAESPGVGSPKSADVMTVRATKEQLASADVLRSSKDPKAWSVKDVGVWLNSLGLGGYTELFASNCVTGADLADLTEPDLAELGLTKIGHKKMLLAGIVELFGTAAVVAVSPGRPLRSSAAPLSPRAGAGSGSSIVRGQPLRSPRSPREAAAVSARGGTMTLRLVSGRNLQDVLFVKIRHGGKVTVMEASRLMSYAELQGMCSKVAGKEARTLHYLDSEKELTLLKSEKDLQFVLDALPSSSLSVVVNN